MTIYLYKKTHNVTGLKYLGQTRAIDPHKYKGSGKRWLLHIKKHGYDVTTEILKECKTPDELCQWGKYYSDLWSVATNPNWANLIPEEGDKFNNGSNNPMHNDYILEKVSGSNHHSYDHALYHFIHETGIERVCTRQELIKEFNLSAGNVHTLLHGNWIVYNGWRLYENKDVDYKKFKSITNSKYDHTIHTFVHVSGIIENCTQKELRVKYPELRQGHTAELARGDRKSYKGWYKNKLPPQ